MRRAGVKVERREAAGVLDRLQSRQRLFRRCKGQVVDLHEVIALAQPHPVKRMASGQARQMQTLEFT